MTPHSYQTKSVDDIYLDDIPNIRHPAAAVRDMEYTANSNSIIQEWNLPVGYGAFVNKYRAFHRQFTWMAYRDVLNDLRNGKIVLLRNNHSGSEIFPVITQSGQLRNDLPASMYFRLSYITEHQLKRPVHYRTINSKAAGRLLAAGGLYNGNIEGFRNTAEQLGGDAPTGYNQVMNPKTKGLIIAGASILGVGRAGTVNELEQLEKLSKVETVVGGAARAKRFSENWPTGDLNSAINKFAGEKPLITMTESGKQIYTHPDTGIQVIQDLSGNYFRINDPSLPGKRTYLDLDGNIPNNKILETGKQVGRTQSEYNQVTHFNIYSGE